MRKRRMVMYFAMGLRGFASVCEIERMKKWGVFVFGVYIYIYIYI